MGKILWHAALSLAHFQSGNINPMYPVYDSTVTNRELRRQDLYLLGWDQDALASLFGNCHITYFYFTVNVRMSTASSHTCSICSQTYVTRRKKWLTNETSVIKYCMHSPDDYGMFLVHKTFLEFHRSSILHTGSCSWLNCTSDWVQLSQRAEFCCETQEIFCVPN